MNLPLHEAAEYLRPWKLATFAVGLALLLLGARAVHAPDWDIPVSFIMATCTYLTAPWSLRVLVERRWRSWPLALFHTWFSVDGSYALYWHFTRPGVLDAMRDVNWPVSLPLYGICGALWLHRGPLAQLVRGRAPQ
jgi:hypothetical protein